MGADGSFKPMALTPLVVMAPVPKLVWLARLTPAKEPVRKTPDTEPVVLSRLIRFVTDAEFCTRFVVPSGAAVTGSVELKTRVPVFKLMFGAPTNTLEPYVVVPVRMIVPPELLLTEFSLVEGLVPVVPLSVLLVCATAGSTKNPATRAAKRCRWRKDCISDFLPIAGLASNLFSRAF